MEETKRRRFIIRAVLEGEVDVQEQPQPGGRSDMNGWTDGVAYTDLEIIENQYINSGSGAYVNYNGWSATGYVPCDGCSSLTFNHVYQSTTYGAFYDADHNRVAGINLLNRDQPHDYTVPAEAHYFAFSQGSQNLLDTIEAGIIPNA